jgi:hypothetical protein
MSCCYYHHTMLCTSSASRPSTFHPMWCGRRVTLIMPSDAIDVDFYDEVYSTYDRRQGSSHQQQQRLHCHIYNQPNTLNRPHLLF